MTNSTGTLTVQAFALTRYDRETRETLVSWDAPSHVEIRASFFTREEAEAFAALFPKSAKFRVGTVSNYAGSAVMDGKDYFSVASRATLAANGVNGGTNETGVKRYRSILRAAAKAGVEVTFEHFGLNGYASQDDFEAALPR